MTMPGSTPRRRPMLAAGVWIGTVPMMLLSGCVLPATPTEHGWTVHARRAVGDVASATATVELVLRQQEAGRLLPNYGRVTVARAEETAGSAADTFAAEQPPPAQRDRYGVLTDAMDRAAGVVAGARMALVEDDPLACAHYCARLHRLSARLRTLEDRL